MTKNEIRDLLGELHSNEAYIRNDAIKKIIKGKISDEHIITALKDVVENDPSLVVRNFARRALSVFGIEHSLWEEPVVIQAVADDKVVGDKKSPDETNKPEATIAPRLFMGLYGLAFFPACFCATQAGYAFDGGYTPEAHMLYWAMVGFPVTILVSLIGMWRFYIARKAYGFLLMALLPIIHLIFLMSA